VCDSPQVLAGCWKQARCLHRINSKWNAGEVEPGVPAQPRRACPCNGKSLSRGASPERLWGNSERASVPISVSFSWRLSFWLPLSVSSVRTILFSQGFRQGTLMPGLLNFLYEQLSYHKILPFVCNLSTTILVPATILVRRVLACLLTGSHLTSSSGRKRSHDRRSSHDACAIISKENLCPITKSSAQN
jgi:hypothetical protein